MSTWDASGQPVTRNTSAAGRLIPPQAADPEPGPAAERLAYSVDEAACLTGLSRDLLYDEMRHGHLGYIKVGRRRLITRQHLEQFLGITSPRSSRSGTTPGNPAAASSAP